METSWYSPHPIVDSNFYWHIADLQCRVSFTCTYSKVNQLYIFMYPLFDILYPYRSLQTSE